MPDPSEPDHTDGHRRHRERPLLRIQAHEHRDQLQVEPTPIRCLGPEGWDGQAPAARRCDPCLGSSKRICFHNFQHLALFPPSCTLVWWVWALVEVATHAQQVTCLDSSVVSQGILHVVVVVLKDLFSCGAVVGRPATHFQNEG